MTMQWGCPWHGEVQGGQLTLPNGKQMAWPQPLEKRDIISGVSTAIPDTFGTTHLVAVPGAPAVERSPEEAAADEAAGMQWRNVAVLSGGRQQLYGKTLDGWIYVDPDGGRWLVKCPDIDENLVRSFAAPLSATVTLARFGEFGAPPEEYSYPISCGWGIDGAEPPSSGRALIDAISPSGSSAVVMVHERQVKASDPQIRWPHSFLEISISGPGAEAIVSCSVIKSRTSVATNAVNWPEPTIYLVGYYYGPPDYEPFDWRVQLESDPTPPGESKFSEAGGKQVGVYSGPVSFLIRRTLAVWYDAGGNRSDVDFVVRYSGAINMPIPSEPHSVTQTGSAAWTAAIEVGGSAQSQISGTWSATTVGDNSQSTLTMTQVIDGQTYSSSQVVPGVTYPGLLYGAADEWRFNFATAASFIEENATTFSSRIDVVRYSPQVIGLRADRPSSYAYHPPVTPSGVATGSPVTADASRKYGSHDPHGETCVWLESSPVCYV